MHDPSRNIKQVKMRKQPIRRRNKLLLPGAERIVNDNDCPREHGRAHASDQGDRHICRMSKQKGKAKGHGTYNKQGHPSEINVLHEHSAQRDLECDENPNANNRECHHSHG